MSVPLIFDLTAKAVSQINAANYPAVLANTGANNNDTVQVSKTPAGSQSGNALTISVGANGTGNAVAVTHSGTAVAATVTAKNPLTVTQSAISTGTANIIVLTGAAHTGMTASAEVIDYDFNSGQTKSWATGAIGTQRTTVFRAATLAFAGASVVTSAATLAVTNAPQAGSNATITNPYAIWAQAGKTQLDGGLSVTGSTIPLTITQSAASSGSPTGVTLTYGAHTGLANAEVLDLSVVNNRTVTFTGGGGAFTQRSVVINAPTYAAAGAQTITAGTTLEITGAPSAGTNVTITNSSALRIANGGAVIFRKAGINVESNSIQGILHVADFTAGASGATATANSVLVVDRSGESNLSILAASSNQGNLYFGSTVSATRGHIRYNHSNDRMTMSASGTIFLTALGTSKVAIGSGEQAAAGTLHVFGNAPDLYVDNQTSTTSTWRMFANTDGICYLQAGSSTANSSADIRITNMTATKVWMTIKGSTAGDVAITANAVTTGTPTAFTVTGAAHTGMTASAEATQALHDFGQTYQWSTGALTTQRFNFFKRATISFVAASTVTNAATLAIEGASVVGTNATITNNYSLWVQAGNSRFDANLQISSTGGGSPVSITATQSAAAILMTCSSGLSLSQTAVTSGNPIIWGATAAAHTGLTQELADVIFNFNRTITYANTASLTALRSFRINQGPVVASNVSMTITTGATFNIGPAPAAGTNVTFTNTFSGWFEGKCRMDAGVALGGGATPTFGTIGGSGPTTAAQNEWLELHTQNGKRFVPMWA